MSEWLWNADGFFSHLMDNGDIQAISPVEAEAMLNAHAALKRENKILRDFAGEHLPPWLYFKLVALLGADK